MRYPWFFSILPGLLCLAGQGPALDKTKEVQADELHRSPIDLALVGDGRLALTSNHTADSVSLVDLDQGKVLAEIPCGRKPSAIAVSPDGQRAAVSNLWSGSLTLMALQDNSLEKIDEVRVGALPRGLVFSGDGQSLFVALAGQDEVIQLEWKSRRIVRRWPALREPRHLALSQDGKWLAAASSRSAQVRCWELTTGKLHWERQIGDAFNLRGLAFTPEGNAVVCAHVVRRDFPVTKSNIEEGWVIDSRLTRLDLNGAATPALHQMALDTFGRAVGDPHGLTFLPPLGKEGVEKVNGFLAVTASGTQELLLLETSAIPWNSGDPGDFLDPRLQKSDSLRRIFLGGRPLAMALRQPSKSSPRGDLVIANYLLDALQIVDIKEGKIAATISLGSGKKTGLVRQGEALFYDARRSHHQWFSCHTCHVEGHTCGLNFDTLNDDSYGTPKLTPSLRHVTRTGPWTWHGQQQDLGAGVAKSFTTTMFGPAPTETETAALLAFLETLEPPPNPHRQENGQLSPAARKGQDLFKDKARCLRCHKEPYYTAPGLYDVKLEAEGSPYKLWNPPALVSLFERGPFLHDGRAKTLEELLLHHHNPEMLGGQKLTAEERAAVIAFLQSL